MVELSELSMSGDVDVVNKSKLWAVTLRHASAVGDSDALPGRVSLLRALSTHNGYQSSNWASTRARAKVDNGNGLIIVFQDSP